jgi:hypothetical protein
LISRYELIFSRRGGTAVVEVSSGICQGCYMNIPPQLWNEIIRNEKVQSCPSCGRIVFCRAAAAEWAFFLFAAAIEKISFCRRTKIKNFFTARPARGAAVNL